MKLEKNITIKGTVMNGQKKAVEEWYASNTGAYPFKTELHNTPTGVVAAIESETFSMKNTVGRVMEALPDMSFDENGTCTDDYELVVTGMTDGLFTATISKESYKVEEKKTGNSDLSEYQAEIDRIVTAGICDEATVRENIRIMADDNGVSEKVIRAVLKQYRKYDRPICAPKTTYVSVNNDGHMQDALIRAINRAPQYFEGGQSCGKNVLTETVAKVMNMPFYIFTFSAATDADTMFGGKTTASFGSYITKEMVEAADKYQRTGDVCDRGLALEYEYYKAKSASVNIVVEDSEFFGWLSEGGVMCFNEMNNADPNFFGSFVNQIADGTGFIFLPGRGRINVNPDCVLIGTQNPGFTGCNEQNQATLSRFGCLDFGYPEDIRGPLHAALKNVECDDPAELENVINQTNKLYKELRNTVQSHAISDACLNIRGFVAAIRNAVTLGVSMRHEAIIQVANNCKSDRETVTEAITRFFE